MMLTGPRDGAPSVAPAGVARPLAALSGDLESSTSRLGRSARVDALALIAQRSAFTSSGRNGIVSVGGSARILRAADGWIALNLPRDSDISALPALFGLAGGVAGVAGGVASGARGVGGVDGCVRRRTALAPDAESVAVVRCRAGSGESPDWTRIAKRVGSLHARDVIDAAASLGLAAAVVADTELPDLPWTLGHEWSARPRGNRPPVVIDLTSLWAGPLAGALLARAGCRVIKVESEGRADANRRENPDFFKQLNSDKETVTLPLPEPRALERLRALILSADLVLDSSRARVMHQWGINPAEIARAGTAWVSITGHGRSGRHANRIAFGDDAAVSAGLVVPGDPPLFVADAIADPIAGLSAAVIAARLLATRRSALVDMSLAASAAWVVGQAGAPIERPVVRTRSGWAVRLHNGLVAVCPPTRETRPVTITISRERECPAEALAVGNDHVRWRRPAGADTAVRADAPAVGNERVQGLERMRG